MSGSGIIVRERIAAGSSSTIYRAEQAGVEVAVKILHPHLASDIVVSRRFRREAEILAGLRHPNIIRVFDMAEIDGRPAMIMELLAGGTLAERPADPAGAGRLLAALASALVEIHGRGIVHRDLRPDHILFDDRGEPRITDFGMASIKDLSGLTRSTVFTASPDYVDPYTWGRGRAEPIADIYSLGAVLHAAVTGAPPPGSVFSAAGRHAPEQLRAALRERAAGTLGEVVCDVIAAMLEPPAARPRSAAEVLEWIRAGRMPTARALTECLHCGAAMPAASPVCMSCGREPLQVRRDPHGEFIALRKISEDQEVLGPFLRKLRVLSAGPAGPVRLIIGDARLYSRAEQKEGVRLPVRIAEAIHPESVTPLIELLSGEAPAKIRITRHPMYAAARVKRGPLIRIREGVILPQVTSAALRRLSAGGPAAAVRADIGLSADCRYAVAIASARLAGDPGTEHLVDAGHIERLWRRLEEAVRNLDAAEGSLRAVRLQELYADLERLDGERGARAEGERRRIVALFDKYADAERNATRLQQHIVAACHALESITPDTAVERLREVETLLAPDDGAPDDGAGS